MRWFQRKSKKKSRRSYAGINTGRLFAEFATSTTSADSELKPALKILRNRCRELARNDEYVKRYLQLLKTNVVGPAGVNLQAKARNPDGKLDSPGNKLIEAAWSQWGKRGNCTADGRLSFVDCQRMVVESIARDGEALVRLVQGADNGDRFALEFIEADVLDEELNITLDNGNQVRMGVEINGFGRPQSYYLLTEHPGDGQFINGHGRKHKRVEAASLLHIYSPERPHQTRGVPPLAAAINPLKMLHGYREAELVASRVGASAMGMITTPDGDGFSGDEYEDSYTPLTNAEPGTFHNLPAGADIKMFDPQHPTTAFGVFHKSVLRGVASSLGISYAALASDLESVNYSSIRQGALDERDNYRTQQTFLIEHFLEPVFRAWLVSAMSFGVLNIPITRYDKFADSVIYRPRGFSWIDPLKEIQANALGIQNGLLSMQDVASNYGREIEEVFEQIAREKELAESHNISLAFQPFGIKAPAQPIVDNEEPNE